MPRSQSLGLVVTITGFTLTNLDVFTVGAFVLVVHGRLQPLLRPLQTGLVRVLTFMLTLGLVLLISCRLLVITS